MATDFVKCFSKKFSDLLYSYLKFVLILKAYRSAFQVGSIVGWESVHGTVSFKIAYDNIQSIYRKGQLGPLVSDKM